MNNTRLFFLVLLMAFNFGNAQNNAEKMVKRTIEAFFEAFHQQDSMALKETVSKDIVLQTIGKDADGREVVKTDDFNHFLKSIVSIPATTKFEEKIMSYNIQIDGAMANAWTNYEFWVNDNFSHCGVNSFQLFNDQGAWKIIYLIDTRRKEGCD
ncbi:MULTISPECIES: nuclear transport factor 2 family protein [Arenibacter]|uniref:nuclear transport factor 2 family protein n=1 Tax=Arenibacter TaxID=178469 RepID=UPI001C0723D3|nr:MULTISPECIES: nuclear transport factor 2 family protein [Arenibacter]MBU2907286.1 nuclear transport factor 2 family protein [Arenibacter algicola]MCK0137124.1 nuclear transport factor 2 family protein [Arenibacter sp. S6351L]